MLDNGVIQPSYSPWASPVVMVSKKDGGLHFRVDFLQSNATTIEDAHPLSRIDGILDACRFSMLDLKNGYRKVPMMTSIKQHSGPAMANYMNLAKSRLLSAIPQKHFPTSWIMFSQVSIGKLVCFI